MDQSEARAILESARYWHYRFELPFGTTTPSRPGWAERVQKRRGHFFQALLDLYGGSLNGKSVLDLGCCQGFWSFESRKAGASSVLGIDSSPFFVKEAEALRTVLQIEGCSFLSAHLEDDPWWQQCPESDITLTLGVLYHLTDPVHVLRKAMSRTKRAIVVDGEVALGETPSLQLRARTPGEPTTIRSNLTSEIRTVPTASAILWLLKDGGFTSATILKPSAEMPTDYHAGTTVSILATR